MIKHTKQVVIDTIRVPPIDSIFKHKTICGIFITGPQFYEKVRSKNSIFQGNRFIVAPVSQYIFWNIRNLLTNTTIMHCDKLLSRDRPSET